MNCKRDSLHSFIRLGKSLAEGKASFDMSTTPQPAATPRGRPAILPMLLLLLLAIAVIGTGAGYIVTSSGPTNYSCMSLSHQGNAVQLKTTGLVHYVKSQYYVTCTEGSPLPTT